MKPYHRPVPKMWWLKRLPYFLFVIRELTAAFVAFYCVLLLVLVYKLGQGREAYEAMLVFLKTPGMISLNVVAGLFVTYHSVTWFNLTPKVMVVQIGEERVPGYLIAGSNYIAWLVVSGVLAWIIVAKNVCPAI